MCSIFIFQLLFRSLIARCSLLSFWHVRWFAVFLLLYNEDSTETQINYFVDRLEFLFSHVSIPLDYNLELLTFYRLSDHQPYHAARKKVQCIDEHGQLLIPDYPNAVKLEKFIFDVFPYSECVDEFWIFHEFFRHILKTCFRVFVYLFVTFVSHRFALLCRNEEKSAFAYFPYSLIKHVLFMLLPIVFSEIFIPIPSIVHQSSVHWRILTLSGRIVRRPADCNCPKFARKR